jgi:hypothetical protein
MTPDTGHTGTRARLQQDVEERGRNGKLGMSRAAQKADRARVFAIRWRVV